MVPAVGFWPVTSQALSQSKAKQHENFGGWAGGWGGQSCARTGFPPSNFVTLGQYHCINILNQCFQNFFARGSLLAFRRTTSDSHNHALGNVQCQDGRNPIFKICISELTSDSYEYTPATYIKIPTSSTRNNTLRDLTLINPLSPELNPICYLLALLTHNFLHVSRIRVKSLTLR